MDAYVMREPAPAVVPPQPRPLPRYCRPGSRGKKASAPKLSYAAVVSHPPAVAVSDGGDKSADRHMMRDVMWWRVWVSSRRWCGMTRLLCAATVLARSGGGGALGGRAARPPRLSALPGTCRADQPILVILFSARERTTVKFKFHQPQ